MKESGDRKKPTKIDRDGVVYTPSKERIKSTQGAENLNPTRRTNRKPVKQKSNFPAFFILVLFVGIIVCVVAFALVFSSATSGDRPVRTPVPGISEFPEAVETDKEESEPDSVIAVVLKTDPADKIMTIYNFSDNKEYKLSVEGNTSLKDKYGTNIVFAEFNQGDIIETIYMPDSFKASSIKLSAQGFSLKMATNSKILPNEKKIIIGNDEYSYTDRLICLSDGQAINITDIDPVDVVTYKGYKNVIWYAEIMKSYGYVNITGKKDIINGSVEIGTLDPFSLSLEDEIKVPEGSYNVVVRGNNIETYTTQTEIEKGKTTEIDLSKVVFNAGYLTVTCNEKDIIFKVNETIKSISEPLFLAYGEYELSATKEGFSSFSKTIKLDENNMTVNIELNPILEVGETTITTDPPGADVYINNIFVGISPVTTSAQYGTKTVTVRKQGYISVDLDVVISDQHYTHNIILRPNDSSTLGVTPTPNPSYDLPVIED